MFIGFESWPRAIKPRARWWLLGELVRTVFSQPPFHLGRVKSNAVFHAEFGDDVIGAA